MTYKEKFKLEHLDWPDECVDVIIDMRCPSDFYRGASNSCNDCLDGDCEECWDSEIPEAGHIDNAKKTLCETRDLIKSKWAICSNGYYPYCPKCMKEPVSGIMTKYCPNCGEFMG